MSLLKVFLCHLDFEDAPDPIDGDFKAFGLILQRAADVCARVLAPSVEIVGFLQRRDTLWVSVVFVIEVAGQILQCCEARGMRRAI